MKLVSFNKVLIFLSSSIVFLGCVNNELDNLETISGTGIVDDVSPSIIIDDLPDSIEIQTDLNIVITDDSESVRTRIFLNGSLLLDSNEKQILLPVNPFDHPVGQAVLRIVSIDLNGNETSIESNFELKRLLLKVPNSNLRDKFYSDNYVMVHRADGRLIGVQQPEFGRDLVFYGTDDTEDTPIIASLFISPKENNPNKNFRMYSFGKIETGSVLPTASSLRSESNFEKNLPIDKMINFRLTSENLISMKGYGYFANWISDSNYEISYSDLVPDDFFQLTSTTENANMQEDYRYLIIDDLQRDDYVITDFLQPSSFYEVAIPEEFKTATTGNYHCGVRGYKNEEDYQNGVFHQIVSMGTTDNNLYSNGFFIPLIEAYEVYDKYIKVNLGDNYALLTRQKGLAYKPFPVMELSYADNTITTAGDYDHIQFVFRNNSIQNNLPRNFAWFYYTDPIVQVSVPYNSIEMPIAVQEILASEGLSAKPVQSANLELGVTASLIKLGTTRNYRNRMFQQNNHFLENEWFEKELTLID